MDRTVKMCVMLLVGTMLLLYPTKVVVQTADDDGDGSPTAAAATTGRQVLVFGGNGFMGADTVERLTSRGDSVTIVNRGNWYWDSKDRILPKVAGHIKCDRKAARGLALACEDLTKFVDSVDEFDAVIDFSAYSGDVVKEAVTLLKDKVRLYVLISTDSVYDVCEKDHEGPTKESDDTRETDPEHRQAVNYHHDYGHRKLQAEEEVTQQREDGGFPYFILRLPDVIGPRDTTYRSWIYQLWVTLADKVKESPLVIPQFLDDYPISFVYSKDVAKAVELAMEAGDEVHDQAVNLAWAEPRTMETLMKDLQKHLGVDESEIKIDNSTDSGHFYMYPSVRRGPIEVKKVKDLLGSWEATPWDQAMQESIDFYNEAMKGDKFTTQRDEIVQIVGGHLYDKHKEKMWTEIEKEFDINLHHFRPRDEL